MSLTHTRPADIERTSMAIIRQELEEQGLTLPEGAEGSVVQRVIHATADFDFAKTLHFTPNAAQQGVEYLRRGGVIVTDTHMACSGVSRATLERLGGRAVCYMADPDIAQEARRRGTTRALVSMERAVAADPQAILAVGNAPTALLKIAQLLEEGARPTLVIGVPVGFVNVVESKERLLDICRQCGVPAIVALGRKGGSTVAAAICNALLYAAEGTLDPRDRGW